MSLRRIFLPGAATLVSIAALVAIAAIHNGDFGDTKGKIFATLATAFVAGSAAIAGIASLDRSGSRPVGALGIVLATGGSTGLVRIGEREVRVADDDVLVVRHA